MINRLSNFLRHNELVKETKELIKEVYLMDSIPWVIGYSGGKDSTTTTQIIIECLLEMKNDGIDLGKEVYVISSDTLVETPMIIQTIKKTIDGINELAAKNVLPIKAYIIRPEYSRGFWANLIGRGYPCPNQTFRWCTDRLKIEPANKFINQVVSEHGEAIMVLGVRDKESNSRDRVLESHTIEGKKLMRHTTMPNAYVFAPIRRFTVDDIWNYLLSNDSPWGADNNQLFKLYSDSSGECPLIIDERTKNEAGSCGQSRFGCWVCTVVKKDKSLSGFIENGVDWLVPLLEYRNWLFSIRDKENLRMKRRSNGTLYFSKIKKIDDNNIEISSKGDRKKKRIIKSKNEWLDDANEVWTVFEGPNAESDAKKYIVENNIDLSSGINPHIIVKKIDDEFYQLGDGPFTLEARKQMLKKLLVLQKSLTNNYQLINDEEIREIMKLWLKDGDLYGSASKIYYEVYGHELKYSENDIRLFSDDEFGKLAEICNDVDFDSTIFNELLQISQKYSGFINRADAIKSIQKVLSKEFILLQDGNKNVN